MKVKHLYLLCFTGLLAVGAASLYVILVSGLGSPGPVVRQLPQVRAVTEEPSAELLTSIDGLEHELNILARPAVGKRLGVNLEPFGYHKIAKSIRGKKGRRLHLGGKLEHWVSFAFVGNGKGFCVIDGSFYPEGGSLPDGGRILKVMSQRVLVEKGKIRKWLPVSASEPDRKKDKLLPGEDK